jgi:hypothetical protein
MLATFQVLPEIHLEGLRRTTINFRIVGVQTEVRTKYKTDAQETCLVVVCIILLIRLC